VDVSSQISSKSGADKGANRASTGLPDEEAASEDDDEEDDITWQ